MRHPSGVRHGEVVSTGEVRALVRLAVLASLVAGGYLAFVLSGPLSVARARQIVDAGGGLAPVVFVVVSASLTLVSFPAPLLAGASGLLFGTAEGTVLSLIAATLGATAAHQLARHAVGPALALRRTGRFSALVERLHARSFVSMLYARILPAMPFALVSYAAGVAAVPLRPFVAATVVGAAPRAFAYTALGGHLGDLTKPESIVAVAILVALALAAPLLARRTRRSERGSLVAAEREPERKHDEH
jgi:uncharacterized membrane protein YdjX (TVP38/TMEM64 family)